MTLPATNTPFTTLARKRCDATSALKRKHLVAQTHLPGITGYATRTWSFRASIGDVPALELSSA